VPQGSRIASAVKDFCIPVRVYYEDTDSAGVVYYANYLKFMERARTEWFRSLGFEQDLLRREDRIVFAVRSVAVEYLRPAHFNDLLEVSATLTEHGPMSCTFEQVVRRAGAEPETVSPETVSKGVVRIACLDAITLRPQRIPQRIVEEMASDR